MVTGNPNHRRARSLATFSRDSDENLPLFSPSRASLSVSSSNDSSDVSVKLGRISLLPISLPKNGEDYLLSFADGGKHDYDWLLTPPGTPLGTESKPALPVQETTPSGRSVSAPKVSRQPASRLEAIHSSRPSRSSSATRSSVSASKHTASSSSSSSTSSILNTSSASVSSSPMPSSSASVPSSPGTSSCPVTRSAFRASSPTPSRPVLSRSATPSRGRSVTNSSSTQKTMLSPYSRPSTQTSKPQFPANSSTVAARSNSRPATSARRNLVPSVSVTSGSATSGGRNVSNGKISALASRPNSAGPRSRPLQQLTHRPLSAGRSRPGDTPTVKGSPKTTGPVTTQRSNPTPLLARGRLIAEFPGSGIVHASGVADKADSPKAFLVNNKASRKPGKTSIAIAEGGGFGRTMSQSSLNMAIRDMDMRKGKGSTRPTTSTTLFPQSIRPSTSKIKPVGASSGPESVGSNRSLRGDVSGNRSDTWDDRSFAESIEVDVFGSSRYDSLLLKEDAKNMNWLHSIDDKFDQRLVFDNGFEPPPEPFDPF